MNQKRIYMDGIFDMFHFGHANALKQAKQLYPDVYLLVGIPSEEDTIKLKGKTILTVDERIQSLVKSLYKDDTEKFFNLIGKRVDS